MEEFDSEVDGWLPVLPEARLPLLTGADLAGAVRRQTATAGGLDGWEERELKALPEPWFDELARILAVVEEGGIWPQGFVGCVYCCWSLRLVVMLPLLASASFPSFLLLYRIWGFCSDAAVGGLVQVLGP